MTAAPDPLDDTSPLAQAPRALAHHHHGVIPLVGPDGTFRGTVHAHDLVRALANDMDLQTPVGTFADEAHPTTTRDATLASARDLLGASGAAALPVLDDADGGRLVGWIDHRDILHALHHVPRPTPGATSAL